MRPGRARRIRLAAALCLAAMAAIGCRQFGGNVETIRFGREITPDGERMRLAALQPRCGCVSLANRTNERLWLESWFFGVPRGSVILEPQERRRFKFDWAGPDTQDYYELVAFRTRTDENGRPVRDESADGGMLFEDALTEYAPLSFMSCDDTTCSFDALAMNRVFLSTGAQDARTTPARGVNISSVIEVAAPLDRCGCMMMRNTSMASSVTLGATLHGVPTGRLTLAPGATVPVPFDWAGTLDSDFYVIEVVALDDAASRARGATSAPQPPPSGLGGLGALGAQLPDTGGVEALARESAQVLAAPTMTIRIRDYIDIVGQLLDMECTPEFAQFQPTLAADGTSLQGLVNVIQCPWIAGGQPALGMYSAYDPRRTVVRPPNGQPSEPQTLPAP